MKLEVAITAVFTIDAEEQDLSLIRTFAKKQFKDNFILDQWVGVEVFDEKATITSMKATLFIDGQHAETM